MEEALKYLLVEDQERVDSVERKDGEEGGRNK